MRYYSDEFAVFCNGINVQIILRSVILAIKLKKLISTAIRYSYLNKTDRFHLGPKLILLQIHVLQFTYFDEVFEETHRLKIGGSYIDFFAIKLRICVSYILLRISPTIIIS